MSGKTHSKATKLAAVVLARLSSPDVAATTFHVDEQTVRRWLEGDPPADDWEQAEKLLLARGLEMSARGQTQGLVATLTAAGISSRHRRYSTLIARREAPGANGGDLGPHHTKQPLYDTP